MFNKFNVKYSVYPSGEKGWWIVVPGYKAMLKEFWKDDDGDLCNTHYSLALDLKQYLGIRDEWDMTAYYEKRFCKMPYSLDGRNMRPIVPLSYDDFIKFKEIQDTLKDEEHPFLTIDYWLIMGVEYRGMQWNNTGNMDKLIEFLDAQLEDD